MESLTSRISRSDVLDRLQAYRGARTFFDPLAGNHGDRLIQIAARQTLDDAGLHLVDEPEGAEVIVLNGGGGRFVQPWCGDLDYVRKYTQTYPGAPFLVLPSSFWWGDADLASVFAGRGAPAELFARDWRSAKRLLDARLPETVHVSVDHDMAFRLRGSDIFRRAAEVADEGYLLVVERFDAEQNTRSGVLSSKKAAKRAAKLPRPVIRVVKKAVDVLRYRTSGFRRGARAAAEELLPSLRSLPSRFQDISSTSRYTFEEFVHGIAASSAVITTRMHVGILSAMLGKPTFFRANTNGYAKLQSVYEFSMADWPNTYVIEC